MDKVCIVGAGAIGGFIGTRLAAAGQCQVSALARGATPVIPAVRCDVPWMPRSNESRYGVFAGHGARYMALGNGLCYPLTCAGDSCTHEVAMPAFIVDGAAFEHNKRRAPPLGNVTLVEALPDRPATLPPSTHSFALACRDFAPSVALDVR